MTLPELIINPRDGSYITYKLTIQADYLADLQALTHTDLRTADYVADRLDRVGRLAWSRGEHAADLADMGLPATYNYDPAGSLVSVSVPTPADPAIAVTVPGEPLTARWVNLAAANWLDAGQDATDAWFKETLTSFYDMVSPYRCPWPADRMSEQLHTTAVELGCPPPSATTTTTPPPPSLVTVSPSPTVQAVR